jgi:hypothetical protein
MNRLTIGEVAKLEQLSGQAMDELFAAGQPKGLAMAAMVFVIQKRTNPELTWEEVLNIPLDDLQSIFGEGTEEDDDPKSGN